MELLKKSDAMIDFNSLVIRFNGFWTEISKRLGKRDLLKDQIENLRNQIETYNKQIELSQQSRSLLSVFAKKSELDIRKFIEPSITEALDFVFSQNLKFHMRFVNRRNQMEVDFIIIRNDEAEKNFLAYIEKPSEYEKELEELVKESRNINYNYGGAINQVLALILRILLVELFKIKGPIILDEPSSAVHEEYAVKLGQLISSFSKRFDRQYIIITHSDALASFSDIKYSIKKDGKDISHVYKEEIE